MPVWLQTISVILLFITAIVYIGNKYNRNNKK